MGATALVVSPYLYAKLPFDPLTDLAPVTQVNSAPLLLVVHPSLPVKSVAELIAYAKAHGAPELFIPRAILVVGAIPVLGSGKIDYAGTTELVNTMRTLI